MWKYLSCKQPEPKKRKTTDDKLETQRQYEKKQRKREFQQGWLVGRPWLTHAKSEHKTCISGPQDKELGEPSDVSLCCSVCIEAVAIDASVGIKNSFINGCKTLKLETIKLHEFSSNHMKARSILKAKDQPLATRAHKIEKYQ